MIEAVKKALPKGYPNIEGFDASCFNGQYVTGDISAEVIASMNAQRVHSSAEGEDSSRLALPNVMD